MAGLVEVLLVVACVGASWGELVELSYTYNVDAPTTPKLKPFTFTVLKKGYNDLGIWVELNEFCASEHSGTHMDAPVHFAKDRWAANDVPLERLWRVPAITIDVSAAIARSGQDTYAIQIEDLMAWEEVHGVIPDNTIVMVRTGWGRKVPDLQAYSGVDANNVNHFPGLSFDAADWLALHGLRHGHKVGIVGVGMDVISMDVGNSTDYPAHRALYEHNIYGLENVANMHLLPPSGYLVTVMPMRIGGGSGAPARIIAELGVSSAASYSAMWPSLLALALPALMTRILIYYRLL